MHIAICDDNVADRKQLERLLGRESDKRKNDSGVFYTDSFGLIEELFPKRKSYDLFFIDVKDTEKSNIDCAMSLILEGVSAPVVIMDSAPQDTDKLPPNLLFLNKPVLKSELSDILDKAVIIESNRIPTIELRHQKDTYYVYEDDIVYIRTKGRYINVYLKDGTMVPILSTLLNFARQITGFKHFILVNQKTIVNVSHVETYSLFRIKLHDKTALPGNIRAYNSIKYKKKAIGNDNECK